MLVIHGVLFDMNLQKPYVFCTFNVTFGIFGGNGARFRLSAASQPSRLPETVWGLELGSY